MVNYLGLLHVTSSNRFFYIFEQVRLVNTKRNRHIINLEEKFLNSNSFSIFKGSSISTPNRYNSKTLENK